MHAWDSRGSKTLAMLEDHKAALHEANLDHDFSIALYVDEYLDTEKYTFSASVILTIKTQTWITTCQIKDAKSTT